MPSGSWYSLLAGGWGGVATGGPPFSAGRTAQGRVDKETQVPMRMPQSRKGACKQRSTGSKKEKANTICAQAVAA